MHFTTVSNSDEILQILVLQAQNISSALSAETIKSQGFLTVRHDPEVLQRMNEVYPSIIAKDGDLLAGYALVMPREFAPDIPVLLPLFEMLEQLSWRGKLLRDTPDWFVMGQVCVAAGYRGQGVFDGMYSKMKESCRADFDFTVTEVAARNTRSLRAHERVGFQTLHTYPDNLTGEVWHVIALDFDR